MSVRSGMTKSSHLRCTLLPILILCMWWAHLRSVPLALLKLIYCANNTSVWPFHTCMSVLFDLIHPVTLPCLPLPLPTNSPPFRLVSVGLSLQDSAYERDRSICLSESGLFLYNVMVSISIHFPANAQIHPLWLDSTPSCVYREWIFFIRSLALGTLAAPVAWWLSVCHSRRGVRTSLLRDDFHSLENIMSRSDTAGSSGSSVFSVFEGPPYWL
jgi:hypothetical protein